MKRHKNLIPFYLISLTMLFGYSCQVKQSAVEQAYQESNQPNIIIIMADDMGYSDLGCFGSEINTPNLDVLAANGLVMSQFYNTSRCCPSRAALLTGVYQHEAGVGNMVGDMGHPSYQGYLNDQTVTVAEVLREAGYKTMMSGKWHLGNEKPYWPRQRGFDRFFGLPQGGGVYFFPMREGRDLILDDDPVAVDTADFYSTDAFNEYAVQFIKEHYEKPDMGTNQPFFLYLPHVAPHFPLQARQEDIAKYRGKYREGFKAVREKRFQKLKERQIIGNGFALTTEDDEVLAWDNLSAEEKDLYDLRMAVYAAQVDRMDKGIGDIIAVLKEQGQLDNTLIIFLSDNGGTHENVSSKEITGGEIGSAHSFTSYSRSWANVSNTPFRMYKHWVHEGGISTPFIAHYPNMIQGHRVDNQVGHIMDIMATCLDLAGASYPDTYKGKQIKPLKGKSLVPIFENKIRDGHEALFWEHEGNRAVRQGKWKLVSAYGKDAWELYDMEQDRTEINNLSEKHPEKVTELSTLYDQWADQTGVLPWDHIKRIAKTGK
jgi:arylsulfatase A-like enzyme